MMKNMVKRIATVVVAAAVLITASHPIAVDAATKKAALNKKSATLTITDKKANPSVTLKVKNAKKALKWTVNNKKIATVKKAGKNTVKITAKKAGKVTVTCKVDGRKLTCRITVVDKRKPKKPDTGKEDTEITNTETGNGDTEHTGDTEDTNICSENTETISYGSWTCCTHLKTGGTCGWTIRLTAPDGTKEECKALADHLYEHIMNGEIPQYH